MMKNIKLFVIFVGVFCVGLSMVLSTISSAQQEISIKAVADTLVETRPPIGNHIFHGYRIIVVLQNKGTTISDNITVKFPDPEFNISAKNFQYLFTADGNATINPGENKTFTVEDWLTPLTGDVSLNISFAPTRTDILRTLYNSGHRIYVLKIPAPTTKPSTPGFEIGFIFIALAVLLLSKKIKK
jgi:hypothetical protein